MSPSLVPRVLPDGFDEATFDKALKAAADVVGVDNVSYDGSDGNLEGPQGQKQYGDVWPLGKEDAHTPGGAIRPGSVSEVQEVLRIANLYKLPLWTVSRGRNFGYGGSAPVVRGSVVLDLHRMNSIIEVNDEYAYAIVEPGVAFSDLYDYIQEKGYDLWPSCPALGWGSVLGNTTERGFGYTSGGEHSQQQCGMEVVLPNGEVLRTGMGAMKNSAMFPLFKGGYGPGVDSLFYQSNLGVVTKIGIHLMPAPESFIECEVSVPNEADLPVLVSTIARLTRQNIIQNHASISNIYRQALIHDDLQIKMKAVVHGTQGGCADDNELATLQKEQGWGYWKAQFAIYGPSPELVNASWAAVKRAFSPVANVICKGTPYEGLNGAKIKAGDTPEGEIPHNGFPRISALPMVNARGFGGGHIDFSPLFPPGGREMDIWYKKARRFVQEANFDFFADFHVFGRYVIAIIVIVYGPGEGPRANELFKRLMKDAVENDNASEYRTHIDYMDEVAKTYNFGDGALNRFVTGLKEHIDPNGILSQGKSGIWTTPRPSPTESKRIK